MRINRKAAEMKRMTRRTVANISSGFSGSLLFLKFCWFSISVKYNI